MKTSITLSVLLLFFINQTLYSQEKEPEFETIGKFIILDYSRNGANLTSEIEEEEPFLVIYINKDTGERLMSNFWPKSDSQSFGPIYAEKTEQEAETSESYKREVIKYNWRYTNTYDGKTGTAKVELLKIYKPLGTYFKMVIIPENLDVLIYKGYVSGTLDLTVVDGKN